MYFNYICKCKNSGTTSRWVESPTSELSVFLAKSAGFAEAMNTAIAERISLQPVFLS